MKTIHRLNIMAGMILALCFGTAMGAESAQPEKTGLAVGKKAPDWTLKDANGKEQSLQALIKNGPVALVFYRSANW